MNPAFAASQRKLLDLDQEWKRLQDGNRLLNLIRHADGAGEEQRSWVVNAALSSGISGLYTGMEEVLRGLLSLVDGYVPTGEKSHQEILDQASVGVDNVRPPIISEAVYDALTDLKGFRHFERHNYRFRFDNTLVEENEERAEGLVPAFIRDVEAFITVMSDMPED
jgi:hypothetical protein